MRDGYEPAPPPDNARHRLRLAWAPAGEGETVAQDNTVYLVFYRMVFASRCRIRHREVVVIRVRCRRRARCRGRCRCDRREQGQATIACCRSSQTMWEAIVPGCPPGGCGPRT